MTKYSKNNQYYITLRITYKNVTTSYSIHKHLLKYSFYTPV